MAIDVDTLTTLTGIDRVDAIAAHVETLPQDLRGSTTRAYQRNLPEWEAARLKYNWLLHACDSRLPPPGHWGAWLILASGGFGNTRGANNCIDYLIIPCYNRIQKLKHGESI